MRFIYQREHQPKLLEWAALHGTTYDFRQQMASAIGVVTSNKLAAVCVYHTFRKQVPDIEMTIIADTPLWCTKGAVRFLLAYPFEQLGCARVTALIGRKNKRSRRMVEGLGWKLEGTCRRAWDGRQDCMVYGLLKDECKWLKPRSAPLGAGTKVEEHGQEKQLAA